MPEERDGPEGLALMEAIERAVKEELDEYIDPPMTTGLTILQPERLWLARRITQRVLGLVERRGHARANECDDAPSIQFKPTPFVYRDPSKIPRRIKSEAKPTKEAR